MTDPVQKTATLGDAAAYAQLREGRDRIMGDATMSPYQQMAAMGALQRMADYQPEEQPWFTIGDVWRGAIGAGLGRAAASGLGTVLGVSDDTYKLMQNVGMGLGGLMNAGKVKFSEDQSNAFRLGFMKAAVEKKLLKEAAVFVPLTVDTLAAPFRMASQTAIGAGQLGGSLIGAAEAPSDTDEELAQLQMQKELLRDQLTSLKKDKEQRLIRGILAKHK